MNRRLAVGLLQLAEHLAGAFDDRWRQSGKARDLNAVGAIGGTRRDLVQEDDVALPLLDAHGDVDEARQARGKRRQLVIVGGEERAAAIDLVQMLDRRPGDGEAVEGRGAAADLIEDDEGSAGRPD